MAGGDAGAMSEHVCCFGTVEASVLVAAEPRFPATLHVVLSAEGMNGDKIAA